MFDKLHEECGVFGIFGHPEAANLTYLGLYALQHRGQESCGIVSSDGVQLKAHLGMGLVSDVFQARRYFRSPSRPVGDWSCPLFHGRRERHEKLSADYG